MADEVQQDTYRGKTVEELKEMKLEEFGELADARVRRKIQRGLTEEETKLLEKLKEKGRAQTHQRNMIVVPDMIGTTVEIYNGQGYVEIEIKKEMLGHYLGEFAKTRKKVEHSAPGLGATRSSKHVPLK